MSEKPDRKKRRILVVVNYASLYFWLISVHLGISKDWNIVYFTPMIVFFVAIFASYVPLYHQTPFWKLTHSKVHMLDERELMITHEATRRSYTIFTIVCLVIIYINVVAEKSSISAITAICILYLAHTLPAAMLSWTEEEI